MGCPWCHRATYLYRGTSTGVLTRTGPRGEVPATRASGYVSTQPGSSVPGPMSDVSETGQSDGDATGEVVVEVEGRVSDRVRGGGRARGPVPVRPLQRRRKGSGAGSTCVLGSRGTGGGDRDLDRRSKD